MIDLLEELIRTPGMSGYEGPIREKITQIVNKYGKTSVDNIGNLTLTLGDGKKHIAFIAHMDELGCVVTHIEDNGFLRIRKVSGDDRSLIGRVMIIYTNKGPVTGVIGFKAPHLTTDPEESKKVLPADRLHVDIGARSRKEAESMGIRILDPVIIKKDFNVMNKKYITARGLDNRIGCTALLMVLESIGKLNPKNKLTFTWSVQEEFMMMGAMVLCHTLKPDIVFVIDTFSTTDCPDTPSHLSPVYLGKGPVLRMVDLRSMASIQLKEVVLEIAKKNNIPIQLGVTGGTTDGAALQESGAMVLPIGVPVRYTHSPTEVGHKDDIDNLIKLLTKITEYYSRGV